MGFVKRLKSSRSFRRSRSSSKKLSKSSPPDFTPGEFVIDRDDRAFSSCFSIATGTFSDDSVYIIRDKFLSSPGNSDSTESFSSYSDDGDAADNEGARSKSESTLSPIKEVLVSHVPRMFIRTVDLPTMKENTAASLRSSHADLSDNDYKDHLHRPSSSIPVPSVEDDPNEEWIALDDGNENKAPLTEAAMKALVQAGLGASLDRDMWTPNASTAKLLKGGAWDDVIFADGPVPVPYAKGTKNELDVFVWSGNFSHSYYGCDIPAVRCSAIVNMSPTNLANLLIDSERVKEYNKMSIGRDDILVLQDDGKCVTKVSVGKSKPPMLGKTLQLKTLLHMEQLPEEGGYIIASRAVAHADDAGAAEDPKTIHSEMLMGINIIRAVVGEPDRCWLTNLNHLRSPMIPMFMAKKLGLSAAVNFINDIRALC